MHARTLGFAAGFAIGVAIGILSPVATEVAVAMCVLALMQVVLMYRSKKSNSSVALFTLLIAVGIFFGVVRVQVGSTPAVIVCDAVCAVEGEVARTPTRNDSYQSVVMKVDDASYGVMLRVPLYPVYEIGQTLRATGKIQAPETSYPHDGRNSFDYVSYLHVHSIGSEMVYPQVEVLDHDVHSLTGYLGRWKENLQARLLSYLPSPESSLASGMLFGNDSIPSEVKEDFRMAGLSHIVVLSGFNIAILIASVLFVFSFLPLVLRVTTAFLFVVLFVIMVGGEASVVRATLMSCIGLIAMVVGREYVAQQALVLSFIAIIMYEPNSLLYDVSLHLSFLATAGIVYFGAPCMRLFERHVPQALAELASTTCVAYMATLPYLAYTFGSVSLYALIANVIVLPCVPIAMLLSTVVVIGSYVAHPITVLIGYVDTVFLAYVVKIAHSVASLPLASVSISITASMMMLLYVAIVGAVSLYMLYKKNETNETRTEAGYIADIISY